MDANCPVKLGADGKLVDVNFGKWFREPFIEKPLGSCVSFESPKFSLVPFGIGVDVKWASSFVAVFTTVEAADKVESMEGDEQRVDDGDDSVENDWVSENIGLLDSRTGDMGGEDVDGNEGFDTEYGLQLSLQMANN